MYGHDWATELNWIFFTKPCLWSTLVQYFQTFGAVTQSESNIFHGDSVHKHTHTRTHTHALQRTDTNPCEKLFIFFSVFDSIVVIYKYWWRPSLLIFITVFKALAYQSCKPYFNAIIILPRRNFYIIISYCVIIMMSSEILLESKDSTDGEQLQWVLTHRWSLVYGHL